MKKPALYHIIFSLTFATAPLCAMQPLQISDKIKVYCDSESSYRKLVNEYLTVKPIFLEQQSGSIQLNSDSTNKLSKRGSALSAFDLVPNQKAVSFETLVAAYEQKAVDIVEKNAAAIAFSIFNIYRAAIFPECYLVPLRRKIENSHQACLSAKNTGISVHLGGAIGNSFYNDLLVAKMNATTQQSKGEVLILESCVGISNENRTLLAPYPPYYYDVNEQQENKVSIEKEYYDKLSESTPLIIYKIQNIEDIATIIKKLPGEANNENASLSKSAIDAFCTVLTDDLKYISKQNVPVAIIVPEPVKQTTESEQIAKEVTACILDFVNKNGPEIQQRTNESNAISNAKMLDEEAQKLFAKVIKQNNRLNNQLNRQLEETKQRANDLQQQLTKAAQEKLDLEIGLKTAQQANEAIKKAAEQAQTEKKEAEQRANKLLKQLTNVTEQLKRQRKQQEETELKEQKDENTFDNATHDSNNLDKSFTLG